MSATAAESIVETETIILRDDSPKPQEQQDDPPRGPFTMSQKQFDFLIKEIRENRTTTHNLCGRVGALETAVIKLQNTDQGHDQKFGELGDAMTTGQRDIERAKQLAEANSEAIKAAHRQGATKGAAKTGASMAVPAIVGIVEIIRTIAEHWPFF